MPVYLHRQDFSRNRVVSPRGSVLYLCCKYDHCDPVDKGEKRKMKNIIFPISMTVLWGITFGSAMHNWTLGICMGLCMGTVFGLFDSENGNRDK